MSEAAGHASGGRLLDVVRDLERQRRINGLLLTVALLSMVVFFRWLNSGPYAGNSVYFALMLVVIGMRASDHQLTQAVTRLASLLAEREAMGARDGA